MLIRKKIQTTFNTKYNYVDISCFVTLITFKTFKQTLVITTLDQSVEIIVNWERKEDPSYPEQQARLVSVVFCSKLISTLHFQNSLNHLRQNFYSLKNSSLMKMSLKCFMFIKFYVKVKLNFKVKVKRSNLVIPCSMRVE